MHRLLILIASEYEKKTDDCYLFLQATHFSCQRITLMSLPVRLLWLSDNANSSLQTRIRSIASDLIVFSNLEDCLDNIISTSSTYDSVLLIVSGSFCQNIGLLIDALPQLRAVYIYCFDTHQYTTLATQYEKIGVNRVFNQENNLIMQLTADLNATKIQVYLLII